MFSDTWLYFEGISRDERECSHQSNYQEKRREGYGDEKWSMVTIPVVAPSCQDNTETFPQITSMISAKDLSAL